MILAALVSFGVLLVAWLVAPAEDRRLATATRPIATRPTTTATTEGLAKVA